MICLNLLEIFRWTFCWLSCLRFIFFYRLLQRYVWHILLAWSSLLLLHTLVVARPHFILLAGALSQAFGRVHLFLGLLDLLDRWVGLVYLVTLCCDRPKLIKEHLLVLAQNFGSSCICILRSLAYVDSRVFVLESGGVWLWIYFGICWELWVHLVLGKVIAIVFLLFCRFMQRLRLLLRYFEWFVLF